MMKRILIILLAALLLCAAAMAEGTTPDPVPASRDDLPAAAETAAPETEVDLDLTELSGSILIARLNEIKSDPWPLAGQTLRVIGQYYEDETRKALIVHNCGLSACEEVGLTLIAPEEEEFLRPEINAQVLVEATLEPFDTQWGTPSARLILRSLSLVTPVPHGLGMAPPAGSPDP